MLAVASAEVPVFFFVSGRAVGMGALANDLLRRTDENGQKRFRTVNTPGCAKNGSPFVPVFHR